MNITECQEIALGDPIGTHVEMARPSPPAGADRLGLRSVESVQDRRTRRVSRVSNNHY